jgi:GTPase
MKPVVAIVGRPNVGKSSLFNRILGRTKALVQDTPGVTRDRNYALARWDGQEFILADTGGYEDEEVAPEERRGLARVIRDAATEAIGEADVILILLDGKEGVNPVDADLVEAVRRSAKPVVFGVNKIDHPNHVDRTYEFFELGIEDAIPVSASHGLGVDDLMEAVLALLPAERSGPELPTPWEGEGTRPKRPSRRHRLSDTMAEEFTTGPQRPDEDGEAAGEVVDDDDGFVLRVAVLGRPNVGKSTLVNRILGFDRCIVSDLAGTTRDSIDTYVELDGRRLILIDTAGIRRRAKINERVERMTVSRALRMVEAAHIVLLLLDATEGVTDQDARLAELAAERGRGLILVANKWDEARKDRTTARDLQTSIERRLPHVAYASVVRISALTGHAVDRLWPEIDRVDRAHATRVETARLNRWLEAATEAQSPPLHHHHAVKMFYATQVGIRPPRIVVFCSTPDGVPTHYRRFMINRLRADFDLHGTPVLMTFRKR